MIDLVSDVQGLRKHLKGAGGAFKDAVIEYYEKLGQSQGFTVARNSSVVKNAFNYGKVDLVWVETNVVFCAEFGLMEDVYRHMFKAMQLKPSLTVFIVSSNSQCKPDKVRDLIAKTPVLEALRGKSVIIDVTGGERILA